MAAVVTLCEERLELMRHARPARGDVVLVADLFHHDWLGDPSALGHVHVARVVALHEEKASTLY